MGLFSTTCWIYEKMLHILTAIISENSRGEWPSDLYSLRQMDEVKLGRVGSNSGLVTSEA